MKVCIDIQSVITNPTGVGRCTIELVKALSKIVNKEDITLSYFNFLGRYKGLDYFPNKQIKIIPGRFYNKLWKMFHFPPLNWFIGNYDIYHFPNFCLPPISAKGKFIITVYDLGFMRYPEYTEPKNLKFLQGELPRSLERSHKIIAISNFTKNELIELFNVPPEKIVVIYQGVNMFERGATSLKVPDKYILCVSTIEPRKNIEGLIRAFRICKLKDYKLVIVGQKGWLYGRLDSNEDVIFMGYVSQDELWGVYRRAKAFVFPSFYEGFGLPPLEAMACGIPVVSTRFEVLGDAARFIDPKNPEDIAEGIREVLNNPEPWINKGFEQVKRFTWQKTAEETLNLYKIVSK